VSFACFACSSVLKNKQTTALYFVEYYLTLGPSLRLKQGIRIYQESERSTMVVESLEELRGAVISFEDTDPAKCKFGSTDKVGLLPSGGVRQRFRRLRRPRSDSKLNLELQFSKHEDITDSTDLDVTESENCDKPQLLSLEELTDILATANSSTDQVGTNCNAYCLSSEQKRRPPQEATKSSSDLLSIDQLTTILRHANLAEESSQGMRMDLIRGLAHLPCGASVKGGESGAALGTSHESLLLSMNESLEESLSFSQIHRTNSDYSAGITLNAVSHSCGSSVTWYEGSDIDEVTVDDDFNYMDDYFRDDDGFPLNDNEEEFDYASG